jgi:GDPmannose 4,6-dehydratase
LKTAIIIGITGQDSAYLSEFLLKKGYKVVGVTRNILIPNYTKLNYLGICSEIEMIEIIQSSPERIEGILKKYKPDEIYNLGAQSSVGQSFIDPIDTVSYNILSVLYWLEGIKKLQLSTRFYQASSSEMFGNVRSTDLPLTESLIFHPASPYGVSKAAAHWLTVNYREANQIFSSCGILFNHESALRGPNYVVKKIINTAVKIKLGINDQPIFVGNTAIKRDWGYAPKYVEAMWKILQYHKAEDFLICSGNVMSLTDLIALVMNNLGLDINKYIKVDPNLFRPVDLEEIYGDNTKAKSLLNWEYNMSNEQLIETLINDEYHFIEWESKQIKK